MKDLWRDDLEYVGLIPTNTDDLITIKDLTARVENLRKGRLRSERAELQMLEALLAKMEGTVGEVKWEGGWYPKVMIRDSHFEEYARDLADDFSVAGDYTAIKFNGATYWYVGEKRVQPRGPSASFSARQQMQVH